MKKIYVAGPYTKGDVALNVRSAMAAANELYDAGFCPFIPHLSHFQHMLFPRPYEHWIKIDLEWLSLMDALLRLPGESSGAESEVNHAKELHMSIFYDVASVVRFYSADKAE